MPREAGKHAEDLLALAQELRSNVINLRQAIMNSDNNWACDLAEIKDADAALAHASAILDAKEDGDDTHIV